MNSAVIADAVRSPVGRGKPGGALSSVHPVDLLAQVLAALMQRTGIDPAAVDDVMTGCVSQVADQSGGIGRFAWLAAGLPESVPGVTIDRRCGSSQQALQFAAAEVMAGLAEIVVVAGVESMSRVPLGSARQGKDPFGTLVRRRYAPGLVSQGVAAELIAASHGFTRDELDAFSASSHERATRAQEFGYFQSEVVPIQADRDGTTVAISADETVRPGTTAADLSRLPASFRTEELAARFPQIRWHITAGNSSPLSDGAAALLVMSEKRAAAEGIRPRARLVSFAVAGVDPLTMLTGPVPATEKILKKSGLSLSAMSVCEVNEAFAPIPLAWLRAFDADPGLMNPSGGAIALGHPLGATGAKLTTSLLCELERRAGRYGLQVMCEGGGMANATIIERL